MFIFKAFIITIARDSVITHKDGRHSCMQAFQQVIITF